MPVKKRSLVNVSEFMDRGKGNVEEEEILDGVGVEEEDGDEEIEYGYGEMRRNEEMLPPVPAMKPSFDKLEEWMKKLTDKQSDRLIVHVYRTHPRIDRKLSDLNNTNSIDKVVGKISKEYMEKTHGGGSYSFIVKDDNTGKKIMESRLNVPMEIDPILDLRELQVEHHLNRGYVNKLKAQGRLNDKLEIVVPKKAGEEQMEAMERSQRELIGLIKDMRNDERDMVVQQLRNRDDSQSKAMMEMMLQASKSSIEMVKEQANQAEKQNNPVMMLELMKMIKETVQENRGGTNNNAEMMQMFQFMMQQQTAQQNLMIELMKTKTDSTGNDLDKLVKLVEVSKLLNGGGSEGGWVDKLVDKGTELLPSILTTLNQAFALSAMSKNPQMAQQMVTQQQQQQQIIQNGENEMAKQQQADNLIQQYGGMILNKLDQGKRGDETAEDFYEAFGGFVFNQIRGAVEKVGVKDIVESVGRNEQMRFHVENKLGGLEEFAKWCMEFMEWKPGMVVGDEDAEERMVN